MATATERTSGQPNRIGAYADRTIVAQRVDGHVQLRDEPATGQGHSYLIEPKRRRHDRTESARRRLRPLRQFPRNESEQR